MNPVNVLNNRLKSYRRGYAEGYLQAMEDLEIAFNSGELKDADDTGKTLHRLTHSMKNLHSEL